MLTFRLCAWKQFKQEILLEHFGGDEYVNQHTSGENVENMDLAREVRLISAVKIKFVF